MWKLNTITYRNCLHFTLIGFMVPMWKLKQYNLEKLFTSYSNQSRLVFGLKKPMSKRWHGRFSTNCVAMVWVSIYSSLSWLQLVMQAAFLVTVVGTTSVLGIITGQLPGVLFSLTAYLKKVYFPHFPALIFRCCLYCCMSLHKLVVFSVRLFLMLVWFCRKVSLIRDFFYLARKNELWR